MITVPATTLSVNGVPVGNLTSFDPSDPRREVERVREIVFDAADGETIVTGLTSIHGEMQVSFIDFDAIARAFFASRGVRTHFDLAVDQIASAIARSFLPVVLVEGVGDVTPMLVTFEFHRAVPARRLRMRDLARALLGLWRSMYRFRE